MKHKAKYWNPQLEITDRAASVSFGSLNVSAFSGQKLVLPLLAGGEPCFVSLLFRDAFHESVFIWAKHIFQSTTRWTRASDMLPPSIARQQGVMVQPDLPPAPLYQVRCPIHARVM
jgi:hypothetical protein